jgi:UDP-glucuronate 4-epimerase
MKILITGVAGFIGSHLLESLLNDNHVVIGIDNFCDFYDPKIKRENLNSSKENNNFTLKKLDIRDFTVLKEVLTNEKPDIVIHLAAMAGVRPSIDNPELYFDVNVNGTENIFKAAKEAVIKKIIYASSSSIYGSRENVPFSETDNVDNPISPYGMTKKINEVMAYTYHHLYKIDMIGLRFFTVYGPRQRPDLAIHKFTRMIFDSRAIPFYGDGSTERDYTYIDDIIDGIVKSVEYINTKNDIYEVFNLGESETTSLKDLVNLLEKSIGKKAIIDSLPMQLGDVPRTYASIDKSKKILAYNPKTKIKDGVPKFIEWYKKINGIK